MGLQKVQYEGCFQVWMIPPLHAKQSVGYPGNGELSKLVYRAPCMQLWQGLHWGDSEKTQNQNEGAPGCLSEGGTGEVSACRPCMGELPPNQVGGDHSC